MSDTWVCQWPWAGTKPLESLENKIPRNVCHSGEYIMKCRRTRPGYFLSSSNFLSDCTKAVSVTNTSLIGAGRNWFKFSL